MTAGCGICGQNTGKPQEYDGLLLRGSTCDDRAACLARRARSDAEAQRLIETSTVPYPVYRNTRRALVTALQVIRSYEADIRNAEQHIGIDLVALGFCQGSIYQGTTEWVEAVASGERRGA